MPEGRYAASDIEVLEPTEAIRRRPRLYVGGHLGSAEVVCNLVLEPLCFAVEPRTGGPAKHVAVRLLSADVAEVSNDGPGLPLGRHPTQDVTFIEVIMVRLHGCRDEKADSGHQKWCASGVAVLNALSEWCVVSVRRDGAVWEQRFELGKAVSALQRVGDCSDTGTTLRFKLDRSVLTGTLEADRVRAALQRFTDDVPCTAVSFEDLRNG